MPLITLKVLRGFVIGTGRTGKAELYVAEATPELEVDDDDVPDTEDGDAPSTEDDDTPSTENDDAPDTEDDDASDTKATDKVQAKNR